ncbi:MAG: cupin domain-containing protein [Thermoanaerobaculia bacterium]|nr:cupin domain-containing protein [Thermoanaerobaculia bacterium]
MFSRALLFTLLVATSAPAADYGSGVTSKVVLKTSVTAAGEKITYPASGEPEVTAAVVEIAPGAATGWHRHKIPLYAWVVAGTLHVEYEGKPAVTMKAGDALVEAVGTAHNGRNLGAEPVKLLVFYTGTRGTPSVDLTTGPVAPAP